MTKIAFECYSPGVGLSEFLRRASEFCGTVDVDRTLAVAYVDWLRRAFNFLERRGGSPRCETANEVGRYLNDVRRAN